MYNLQLNQQEKDVLVALIDIAVKAAGVKVAGDAAYLAQKIEKSKVEEKPEQPAHESLEIVQ